MNIPAYQTSVKNLVGVHPLLVTVVEQTALLSPLDFKITDGVRTLEEEKNLVATGKSTTLNSMHIPQTDGLSHAVDLAPVRNGVLSWDWPDVYILAHAVREAAKIKKTQLVWGGAWDLKTFTDSTDDVRKICEGYASRRKKLGKRVFLDGFHFQLA